ncbi:MAG: hypothetical protein N3G21_00105 [Candidatus Hydrogenedentes bacterium]|nr:hypothetical protein [Candidatus Hydrogenedentota bacterium]
MVSALVISVIFAVAMPESYLLRTADALIRAQEDIPAMVQVAEMVANQIAAGGKLYAGGNPALVSEVSGRAGGLMLITSLQERAKLDGDAVLFFADAEHPISLKDLSTKVCWVVFGVTQPVQGANTLPMRDYGLSPTLTMAIQSWMFIGELISACTRLGKMPVLYESIGLYGGIPRQQKYQGKNIFWHEEHQVPQISPGTLAREYALRVSAMLRRCEEKHRSDFERIGIWVAEANKAGHNLRMYSMGHLFPNEVNTTAIGRLFISGVWNAGFSYIPEPNDQFYRGDVIIHIGYQHPPRTMLERATSAGAKAVYVAPYMDRDYPTDSDTVWIDPMYPFGDACVPISGYDIPALPASGVVNAAIAWEIYRVACVHGAKPKQ